MRVPAWEQVEDGPCYTKPTLPAVILRTPLWPAGHLPHKEGD
jgi:hypothetical protein